MNRAYSFLHIKAVDGEQRIITGTATTPTPDRMGDVVEPLGVQFKNPIPLLLYHNSQKPVGWVRFSRPTKDGIGFEAKLPIVDEPGTVRDRIEEAWTSIKTGLLAGVSIGFRAIEEAFNKDTGGFRFIKTEVLELSLVAIPAQPDARIDTIKAYDIGLAGASASETSAGVSATTPRTRRASTIMAKTISDRVTEFRTERKAIAQKMESIMEPVVAGTGDLTTEKQTEYDELTKDLNDVDASIVRFEALERASVAPKAAPIHGGSFSEAADSRAGHQRFTVKSPELQPGIAFTRAFICKAAARMFFMSPMEVARERYPSHPEIEAYLKTAVTSQTTATDTALVATPTTLVSEFLDFLRPMTIVGKFGTNGIPSLTRVPFNSRIQEQTTGGTANWVGAGIQKPVTRFNFDAQTLTWAKIAAINVMDEELIRFSTPSAEGRVRDALAGTIKEKMDIDFIDPGVAASVGVSPASITNGISALAHSGTNAAAVRTAIQAALGAFIGVNADVTQLVWIMPATTALSLQLMLNSLGQREFPNITMNGGTLEGFPVITSQYAATVQGSPTSNIVILVNAKEIFLADDGGVTIDMSNQASIEMSDDPANDTGTLVHLFQANKVAFRAERFITWARGRSSSVVWFNAVAWAA